MVKLHDVKSHSESELLPVDKEVLIVIQRSVGWRLSAAGHPPWSSKLFEGPTGQNRGLSGHSGSDEWFLPQ